MSTFTFALVAGFIIVVLTVIPGYYLWWPSRRESSARSDLGVALMTGALIAFAVLTVQVTIDRNIRQRDEARQRADARQSFELTLNLQDDLTGIRLDGRNLRGFYLYKKRLVDAELNRTDLRDATLIRSNLSGARMRDAQLAGAIMNGALLEQTKMERANLHETNLFGANMLGAVLRDATVSQTEFTSANLEGVDLRGAHMEGASLAGATLIGADMSDALVDSSTTFAGAIYDSTTIFPPGVVQDRCRRKLCEAH